MARRISRSEAGTAGRNLAAYAAQKRLRSKRRGRQMVLGARIEGGSKRAIRDHSSWLASNRRASRRKGR